MNKLINRLLLIAALVFTLSSCREEAEIPGHGTPKNPEKEVAGTYVGTWTKTQRNSTNAPVVAEGSLTLAENGEAYVGTVTLSCDDANMGFSSFTSLESTCNVIYQTGQYAFHNPLTTNGLGTPFTGSVSFGGEATMSFAKTIRSGRVTYTYDYVFNGKKQ